MKTRTKRILMLSSIVSVPCLAIVLAVGFAASLPPSIGRPIGRFGYNYLSIAPRNHEPYGVYVNKPFDLTTEIAVSFYDVYENNVLIIKPGGDDHRSAAMQKVFHLRVNAPNSKDAVAFLQKFFADIGFRGSIRLAATFAHGAPASPRLGRTKVGPELFEFLSKYRPQQGYTDLSFVSCDVAKGAKGREFIQQIADKYELRVIAPETKVSWDFWAAWFKRFEGLRNYDVREDELLVTTPHESKLKRLSEY